MHVHYRWQTADSKTHYFKIILSLNGKIPAQDWQLWMPVWTPGSYLVREFSRHVHHVHATLFDHEHSTRIELPLEKISKNHWVTNTTESINHGTLVFEYQVYAFDNSVRAAYFDPSSLAVDGAAIWLSVEGTETLARTIEWVPPEIESSWKLATPLEPEKIDEQGFGTYRAKDYLQQVDSPALAGTYLEGFELTVQGIHHTMMFDDAASSKIPNLDLERLKQDMTKIIEWQYDFWPGEVPFSHYHTLTQVFANNYGGLEHENSTRLVCSRYDVPRLNIKTHEENYSKFLGLFSHEYFHSWLVKRLRPHTLLPYELKHEQYTPLLWIFEGFTAYFDEVALVQTGLISIESYLGMLEKLLDRVTHLPAHTMHSLEEASFDAWIRSYRPDENTPNSTVSYYDQGALHALVLDLTLMNHGSSLKAVLRHLWQHHIIEKNNTHAGLQESDLLDALVALAPGVDWANFLAQHVHSPLLPDYEAALNSAGIYIKVEESTTPKTTQHFTQCLGVRFREGTLTVSHVLHGRIAALSGVQVGDQWLALNHEQLKSAHWSEVFARLDCDAYHDYNLHFFREGQLHTLALLRPQHTLPILRFHKLYQNTPVTAQQKNIASQWFNTGS
ncbi:MAG: hypothetical protein V4525_13180 [Pseudomonadota bacterium]